MKWHPASMMLTIWAISSAMFIALPFQLVGRELSIFGLAMLGVLILAFCIGAWLRTPVLAQRNVDTLEMLDFARVDMLLVMGSVLSMFVLLYEWWSNGGGLSEAWSVRSERATAILYGTESGSSLAFQIGFLFSPVGYTIIAREIIFRPIIRPIRLAILGFGPLVMSSLALGGRAPLLWGFTIAALSLLAKRTAMPSPKKRSRQRNPQLLLFIIIAIVAAMVAMNYFVQVFVVRAEGVGGIETMFDLVAPLWGVTFDGPLADFLKALIGNGNTYLVFVFAWYITQSIVISNSIFTHYSGPPMLGVYGIELLGAVVRRIDGNYVSQRNLELNDIQVFGFLPGAFGTLFVDYWYFGIIVSALWGYIAAVVYERARSLSDARWLLAAPFAMQGILASVINTPLGTTNGLVTLSWMIFAFVLTRPRPTAELQAG